MNSKTVAIIGAGIVGVSTAIWLQRNGHKVILIDKEGPAAGTSYGNGGVLAACGVVPVNAPGLIYNAPKMLIDSNSPLFVRWGYLPRMLPWLFNYLKHSNKADTRATIEALTALLSDSLIQHQELTKGTSAAHRLTPSDYVFVYKDRSAYSKDSYAWRMRREMGFEWDELEGDELLEYDPMFQGSREFAIRLKDHGVVSKPGKYVEDLTNHMQIEGGQLDLCEVLDIDVQDGKAKGVITNTGKIACDNVVLTAGVWSKELAEKLGIQVSMETERGYHIDLINASVKPRSPMMLASGKFVISPMEDRMRCAGIVEFGGLKTPQSESPLQLLKRQIHEVIPGLKYDDVEEWLGHRPAPTDSIPLIGATENVRGVYAAFGHHHIGLTAGPKTGRMIANLITNKENIIDLAPYRVMRFTR